MISRNQAHFALFNCFFQLVFYSNYELRPKLIEIFNSNFVDQTISTKEDKENLKLYKKILVNGAKYIDDIALIFDAYLTSWRFERLCYTEQAILILAYVENICHKFDKILVINIAIKLAKLYGANADSYKYINAVLDKVLKWMQ